MKVIKSGTGNDYAVVSPAAARAALRHAHALGVNRYREQSHLQAKPRGEESGLVPQRRREDPYEQAPRELVAPEERPLGQPLERSLTRAT